MSSLRIQQMLLGSALLLTALYPLAASAVESDGRVSGPALATHDDARFGFSFQYPKGWFVQGREDRPGTVGEVLQLVQDPLAGGGTLHRRATQVIEIGFHSVPIPDAKDIVEWSEELLKDDSWPPAEVLGEQRLGFDELGPTAWETGGRGGRLLSGVGHSPFTFVEVPRGEVVWFLWTNAAEGPALETFLRLVRSFRFSDRTPKTLEQAHGPGVRSPVLPGAVGSGPPSPVVNGAIGDYGAPVANSTDILCGNGNAKTCCGSHGGWFEPDEYAIDINVNNVAVKAAHGSTYDKGGYNPTGTGVWVRYNDGNQQLRYAHLSWYYNHLTTVAKGTHIAQSGSSGGVGPHLHFVVRNSSNDSINLEPASDIDLYEGGNYPSCGNSGAGCPSTCSYFQCTCGWVN